MTDFEMEIWAMRQLGVAQKIINQRIEEHIKEIEVEIEIYKEFTKLLKSKNKVKFNHGKT